MIVLDLEHMSIELARKISTEDERTGVKNTAHIAYSTLAKAMTLRRTKVLSSGIDVRARLDMPAANLKK